MTDDRTPGEPVAGSGEPRAPEPERPPAHWSRSDPMAVPATAPVWTYQQRVEPPTDGVEQVDAPVADGSADPGARRRGRALGTIALLLAVVALAAEIGGILVSLEGDFAIGTVLAIVAIAASVLAVVVGIVAIVLRAGRVPAVVATVLGVAVNPLVLNSVLGLLAGVSSID